MANCVIHMLTPLENIVVEAVSKHGAVVWSSKQKGHPAVPKDSLPLKLVVRPEKDIQRHLPDILHVQATGLGGRDLIYPIPLDISIRSDKERATCIRTLSCTPPRNSDGRWHVWRHRDPAGLCVGQEQSRNIGMRYWHKFCQQSSSRVLQPVGPLL